MKQESKKRQFLVKTRTIWSSLFERFFCDRHNWCFDQNYICDQKLSETSSEIPDFWREVLDCSLSNSVPFELGRPNNATLL